jgi:hypothetical protein
MRGHAVVVGVGVGVGVGFGIGTGKGVRNLNAEVGRTQSVPSSRIAADHEEPLWKIEIPTNAPFAVAGTFGFGFTWTGAPKILSS